MGRGGGGVQGEKWDRCLGGHKAPFSYDTNPTAWPSLSLSVSPSRLIFLGRNHVLFIHLHYPRADALTLLPLLRQTWREGGRSSRHPSPRALSRPPPGGSSGEKTHVPGLEIRRQHQLCRGRPRLRERPTSLLKKGSASQASQ